LVAQRDIKICDGSENEKAKDKSPKDTCWKQVCLSMINIAIPKGSLQNQTLQLFSQAGLEIRRTEREYNAQINDPRVGKVKILRPQEIPSYVAKGYFVGG
jgi:hypothetical protein